MNKVPLTVLLAALLQAPLQATPHNPAADPVEAARRVVATLQLAAQEYRLAWRGSVMVNAAEWEEARLFVAEARVSAAGLPPVLASELEARLAHMALRLDDRYPVDSMAAAVADIERRLTVALGVSLDERPSREPSLASGARIYRNTCSTCHGETGRGDGLGAAGLDPPVADLTDRQVLASATPLDFYRRVTHGVPGTAMPPYGTELSREERWDVVAHVFALSDSVAQRGRSGQLAVVFGTVRGTLGGAVELAGRGESEAAGRRVLDAYMAFEAVEGSLGATEPRLVSRIEERFMRLREVASRGSAPEALAEAHASLLASLAEAQDVLVRGRSPAGLFAESFLLLLREGFEAILVIGAIMAVLLKAGAKRRQREVRWGIAAAVAASLLTAAAFEWVFRVSPAQQEALEGGVMLLAAAVLFYVSYWLLSKVELAAWTRFVKGRIQKAVEAGSGLTLAGVAFLAVYREGFETVLFYKALFVSGGSEATSAIMAGMLLGAVVLVALYFGIEKFGIRVPMRPFFAVTSATLAYLAFVFAGQGIKELQEGGYVGATFIAGAPRNDFLGIYPTFESLAAQLVIVACILFAVVWTFVVQPRRIGELPAAEPPAAPEPVRERETAAA